MQAIAAFFIVGGVLLLISRNEIGATFATYLVGGAILIVLLNHVTELQAGEKRLLGLAGVDSNAKRNAG